MIGSRIGSKSTLYGSAVGSGADDEGGFTSQIPGVTRDSGSGRYVPQNATEWTALMAFAGLVTGNPSLLWLCQEASGNLADSIGSFTGAVSGTGLTYQQSVPGWARKGIKQTEGTSLINNTDAGLPDLATNSALVLSYTYVQSQSNNRTIHFVGTPLIAASSVLASGIDYAVCNGVSTFGVTNMDNRDAVRVIKFDRTNSVNAGYNNADKMIPAFQTAIAGKRICIGGANSATMLTTYAAAFFNSAAELSDAQVKALLTALGWAIPWS
jgi:hypothetical protein